MNLGRAIAPRPKESRADPRFRRLTDEQLLGLFIDRGDEAAFESIIDRHGPRVLRVCRQVLRRPHDAEDVFQATFLLLATNAAQIRKRASLGDWLYGVAHRVAVRSNVKASRRSVVEGRRRGDEIRPPTPDDEIERRELRRVVHEEIDRLPERLRLPVLLCYLEGRTNEDVAKDLGCPSGTVKFRLAKAREVLHGRLSRRGITLTVALLLLLLPRSAPAAIVPRRLARSTLLAATSGRGKRGLPHGATPRWQLPLPLLAVSFAAVSAGALAAGLLYLSSPERTGLLTWFLGAVRRACH
jgi:polysaccharide export outer membrane protein